jgi:hypothetical protein
MENTFANGLCDQTPGFQGFGMIPVIGHVKITIKIEKTKPESTFLFAPYRIEGIPFNLHRAFLGPCVFLIPRPLLLVLRHANSRTICTLQ